MNICKKVKPICWSFTPIMIQGTSEVLSIRFNLIFESEGRRLITTEVQEITLEEKKMQIRTLNSIYEIHDAQLWFERGGQLIMDYKKGVIDKQEVLSAHRGPKLKKGYYLYP